MTVDGKPVNRIVLHPIGVVRSPHTNPAATPIQPRFAHGAAGRVEVFPEYAEGLKDLEGFSHIYLIYYLHKAGPARLITTPFLEDAPRGVFATRAPSRPNAIGLSIVRLIKREGSTLHVDALDILDGTPLLDIKPYVPRFDPQEGIRIGWLESVPEDEAKRRGRRGWRGGTEQGLAP
jgi:tRNA-Thr(GGU) m(6)t(6)A37 methyltransferase TsaA